jgi:hypothetical protein
MSIIALNHIGLIFVVFVMVFTPELDGMTHMIEELWKSGYQIPAQNDPPNSQPGIQRRCSIKIFSPFSVSGLGTSKVDGYDRITRVLRQSRSRKDGIGGSQ